ncbi:YczE/YyaS/YitT family protein [Weissella tructae]|jgi:hypothetical protein|uniref:Integral membrane protein n=1 Tax=Weissella ceti TaxID=759620 RepID=A0A088GK52_9LACO|nr:MULTISPECIES: hypothetical protein [Weissella]AIM62274.1 hypothetical protein WS74_0022 [Weissella ceti]AIM63613.1 hypothetical protein WS105_0023 [Weissella ceti]ELA07844.1 hypothetical protein WCNC_01152 [Weissella ceti NC36]QVV91374.1 hypothetical protein KHQ32_00195 [Weissella tructae]
MKFVKKVIFVILGLGLLALGAAILSASGVGVDPYTAMNLGIGQVTGLGLGTAQLLVNVVLFVFVILNRPSVIGLGTAINIVFVGYAVQFFSGILNNGPLNLQANYFVMALGLVVGILVYALGITMYVDAGLGQAPYEAVAPILSDKLGTTYSMVRTTQDVLVLALALVCAGFTYVGIGTIICAVGTGSLITAWRKVLPGV